MSKQTLTKTISTLTKSEENFQKKFLKHSQDTLDQGKLLKGIDIWSGAAWSVVQGTVVLSKNDFIYDLIALSSHFVSL